jgi:anti-sigma regulatory factor (Ser/Thr protein kinase)
MLFSPHQSFPISDRSFAHTLKKDVHKRAEAIGFTAAQLGKIDIIVSELISNLLKHTPQGGELLVKPLAGKQGEEAGIELLCVDTGPGMRDPLRMLEDGVSTAGSKGEGLGAIKRLSDEFDLYSLVGSGTVVLSRLFLAETTRAKPAAAHFLDIRAVMLPKPGETFCGDNWSAVVQGSRCAIAAVDGLGHGEGAFEASREATEVFARSAHQSPSQVLVTMHEAIRKTRGAVGAAVTIDQQENRALFCGIGNIMGKIHGPDSVKSLISYNGMLGNNRPAVLSDHANAWDPTSLMILHSDGIKSRWDLGKYPGLKNHDLSVIAAVLYKDFTRKTDDVLVIAARNKR